MERRWAGPLANPAGAPSADESGPSVRARAGRGGLGVPWGNRKNLGDFPSVEKLRSPLNGGSGTEFWSRNLSHMSLFTSLVAMTKVLGGWLNDGFNDTYSLNVNSTI